MIAVAYIYWSWLLLKLCGIEVQIIPARYINLEIYALLFSCHPNNWLPRRVHDGGRCGTFDSVMLNTSIARCDFTLHTSVIMVTDNIPSRPSYRIPLPSDVFWDQRRNLDRSAARTCLDCQLMTVFKTVWIISLTDNWFSVLINIKSNFPISDQERQIKHILNRLRKIFGIDDQLEEIDRSILVLQDRCKLGIVSSILNDKR